MAEKAKPKSSLRAKAIESAAKFDTRKKTWFEVLELTHPQEAEELRELVLEWVEGDKELRAAYPSARMLAKFIMTLPYVPVRYTTIRCYLESQQNEAQG